MWPCCSARRDGAEAFPYPDFSRSGAALLGELTSGKGFNGTDPYVPEAYDASALILLAMQSAGSADSADFKGHIEKVANTPGEDIFPGELAKALGILADGGDVDYVGGAAMELIGPGEAAGNYREVETRGGKVRVTSLERTLVDVLVRPGLGGGWEEVWRSLGSVEYFDLDQVTDYTLKLRSATAVARVGFFLEQHREALMVDESYLAPLRKCVPKQPCYLERSRRTAGKLVPNWNIVVPSAILEPAWEEAG